MFPVWAMTMGGTVAAVPIVSAVAPNVGDTAGGGGFVAITVNDSTGCTGAALGGVAMTSFSIVDATHVKGIPGAHAVGAVAAVVTNATGPSTTGGTPFEYWTPSQITGIDAYVDANKGVTGGATVSAWLDQSANARNFVQATGANKPAQTASVFGTLPSIRFTPQQFVSLATAINLQASGVSIFAVAKWTATTTTTAGNAGNCPLTIVGDRTNAYGSFGASAGAIRSNHYTGSVVLVDRGTTFNDGVARLIGATYDAVTNVNVYVGATLQGSTSTSAALVGTTTYDTVGAGYPASDGMSGDLGAVVVSVGVMSSTDRTKLNSWSMQRFGTP